MSSLPEPERWPALESCRQLEALMLQRIQNETQRKARRPLTPPPPTRYAPSPFRYSNEPRV